MDGSERTPLTQPLSSSAFVAPLTFAKIAPVVGFTTIIVTLTTLLSVFLSPASPTAWPPSAPVARPQQLFTVLGSDPNTELRVSWAIPSTGAAGMDTARVVYSYPAAPLLRGLPLVSRANCTRYSYMGYDSPLLCSANLTVPASRAGMPITYAAGDDVHGFSAARTASTAPQPAVAGTRIAVFGDLGTTNNSATTLQAILASHAASPFSAALLVGDLSYSDGNQSVWDEWGRLVEPLASVLPTYTVIGNHEWFDFLVDPTCDYKKPPYCNYTLESYLARMHTPSRSQPFSQASTADTLYTSTSIGLVHLILLQGYCPAMKTTAEQPCLAPGSPQAQWLASDLAAVNRTATPWVVVAIHQPYVNSNKAHPMATEGAPVQAALETLLVAGGVDLVLAGHIHAYERSCRVQNLVCTPGAPTYLTIGDAGNREGLASKWVEPQPEWSLFRSASYGHLELLAPNSTHLQAVWAQNPELAPTLIDSVWLVKGEMGQVGGGVTRHVNASLPAAPLRW